MDGRALTAALLALTLGGVFAAMQFLAGATRVRLPLPADATWAMSGLGVAFLVVAVLIPALVAQPPGGGEASPAPVPPGSPRAILSWPVAVVLLVVGFLVSREIARLPPRLDPEAEYRRARDLAR